MLLIINTVPTSMRRSMPNLALVKDANRRKPSTALQTIPKCQPQYISDSKLDDGRARTKVIGSANPNYSNRRHSNQYQYSSQEQESSSTQMKKPVYVSFTLQLSCHFKYFNLNLIFIRHVEKHSTSQIIQEYCHLVPKLVWIVMVSRV